MTPGEPKPIDAVALLAGISSVDVRARLDAIEAERKALTTLLRSVRARERAAARQKVVPNVR